MDVPAALKDKIEEARRRLERFGRWRAWLHYCLFLCAGCLGFAVVSRFVYVPYSGAIVACAAAAGAIGAAVLAWRAKVGSFAAAARLDLAEGLKERLSTVVEVSGRGGSGEVVEALFTDAVSAAQGASPRTSLMFHAPRTLPLTLGFAIACIAVVLSPRAFGRDRSSLPPDVRIAIQESVRMGKTAELLEEGGAQQSLVEQLEKLRKELEKGDLNSVKLTLEAVSAAVGRSLEDATRRDSAVEALEGSEVLSKLAELISSNAPAREFSAEAAAVFDKNAREAAEILREVADRLKEDSKLRESVENAIKALNERDREAFMRSMEDFKREAQGLPGTDVLKHARRSIQAAAVRLGAGKGGQRATQPGQTASPGTALEEAMEREKVPERFRSLVRMYFARANQD